MRIDFLKHCLQTSKQILENTIEFLGEGELTDEEINSVEHYLKAMKIGCECDDYNGYDCGCSNRAFLCDEGLKELKNK